MGYEPLEENGKFYASSDGKTKFRDWLGDPLELSDLEHAKSWCDAKNAIDKVL